MSSFFVNSWLSFDFSHAVAKSTHSPGQKYRRFLFLPGRRCDWHHCQTHNGNMDWQAAGQNWKLQVHLRGCAVRGGSRPLPRAVQRQAEVHRSGGVEAPQLGGDDSNTTLGRFYCDASVCHDHAFLQEYSSSLQLYGYQTVDDLMRLRERHLMELNVTDPEHRHRLLAAVRSLQQLRCE